MDTTTTNNDETTKTCNCPEGQTCENCANKATSEATTETTPATEAPAETATETEAAPVEEGATTEESSN
ncbi:MAG: hypothetical protein QG614_152 [Patescibacteria group bacterium]|nr:hypothetical protein [Patescibacteria group bacterium]